MIGTILGTMRDATVYPIAALLIFFLVFVGVLVRTLRARPADLDALGRLPLDAGETIPHEGGRSHA